MFVDLHAKCATLKSPDPYNRGWALSNYLPAVSVTAIGGFPIVSKNEQLQWCNNPVSIDIIRKFIHEAVGESAILTYTNRKNKTREELADLCFTKNHLWGLNWINLTLTFAGWDTKVELALARDKRFWMSWPVEGGKVFSATGSLKDWIRYASKADDLSFDKDTREVMGEVERIISELL